MNFLLGTLLIILLLFPGFLFRTSYLSLKHGRSFRSTFVEESLFSIAPALVIHLVCLLPVLWLMRFNVDGFYLLMINRPEATDWMRNWDILKIIGYFIATCAIGLVSGYYFRKWLVEPKNWDLNIPLFRTRNEWYYILQGYLIDVFDESGNKKKLFFEPDEIRVDVVVEIGKEAYIYRGILVDFVLSKDDGFDRIYLADVTRRPFTVKTPESEEKKENTEAEVFQRSSKIITQDGVSTLSITKDGDLPEEKDDRYYSIPGWRFVIPYKEIKNINLKYVFILSKEENEELKTRKA